METWNREELYAKVWTQPASKVALKYGISAVMLGKVCRKLQIPVPGRGYWAKKEFGKPVKCIPLPEAKELPVAKRFKDIQSSNVSTEQRTSPASEPTDEYHKLIVEMESRTIPIDDNVKQHKLVPVAEKTLSRSKPDNRGVLERSWDQQPCLDIRVTKNHLNRALIIADALVKALEAAKFPVSVQAGRHSTTALIFGHAVPLAITERIRETGRRKVTEYSWTRTLIEYEATGMLEFRAGDYTSGRKLRDGKRRTLEGMISRCIGLLMREARDRIHEAEQARLNEIEDQKRARERAELAQEIAEEDRKIKEFEGWVESWQRARQMREFTAELEKAWTEANHDLSLDAPKGKRILWMREQADRIDPMRPSPPSILDRRRELSPW